MERNLKQAIEWAEKEGHQPQIAREVWSALFLNQFPSGLDYYVLDCALAYGFGVPVAWLNVALNTGLKHSGVSVVLELFDELGSELDVGLTIDKLDVMRRRRTKLDKNWPQRREALMNRVLRVKKRAVKLLISKENGDEETASHGVVSSQHRVCGAG